MESLYGEVILRDNAEAEADDIFSNFKEFLLVFYGAAWSPKCDQIASAINTLVVELNPEDESMPPAFEVFYISNDSSKSDFKAFYAA